MRLRYGYATSGDVGVVVVVVVRQRVRVLLEGGGGGEPCLCALRLLLLLYLPRPQFDSKWTRRSAAQRREPANELTEQHSKCARERARKQRRRLTHTAKLLCHSSLSPPPCSVASSVCALLCAKLTLLLCCCCRCCCCFCCCSCCCWSDCFCCLRFAGKTSTVKQGDAKLVCSVVWCDGRWAEGKSGGISWRPRPRSSFIVVLCASGATQEQNVQVCRLLFGFISLSFNACYVCYVSAALTSFGDRREPTTTHTTAASNQQQQQTAGCPSSAMQRQFAASPLAFQAQVQRWPSSAAYFQFQFSVWCCY